MSSCQPSAASEPGGGLVWATHEAQAFDAFLQDECGIPAALLMENAGAALAGAIQAAANEVDARRVLFMVGPGNNGGDALVAARHLHGRPGLELGLWAPLGTLAKPQTPSYQALETAQRLGLPVWQGHDPPSPPDLLVDGLFGLGLSRPLTGEAARAVETAERFERPILSVDLPSGLDGDSGRPLGLAIHARWTLTFVGLKAGCLVGDGPAHCGILSVAGIGVSGAFAEAWLQRLRAATPGGG